MQAQQVARFSNFAGGTLTLGSVLFPWFFRGPDLEFLRFDPSSLAGLVPWIILAGGVVSLLSRYGGLTTITGIWTYTISAPRGGLTLFPVDEGFAPGFWMAWVGALITFLGLSSNFRPPRFAFPRPLKWALPPLGVLMVVFGAFYLFPIASVRSEFFSIALMTCTSGVLVALLGMTQNSVLVDHDPQLGF